jgi:GTP-binding protein
MASGLIAAKFVTSVYDHRKTPAENRKAVAIAGRSNVGKSTLINSITEGKKIAKVSSTPGKTQALNFFLADNKFHLVDLPGYGFAKVPVAVKKSWGVLVEGYLTENPNLMGLVFLVDCRRDLQPDDITLMEWVVNRELPFLIVMTKADKLNRNNLNQAVRKLRKVIFGDENLGDLIPFSAKSGIGKKEVLRWIRAVVS